MNDDDDWSNPKSLVRCRERCESRDEGIWMGIVEGFFIGVSVTILIVMLYNAI